MKKFIKNISKLVGDETIKQVIKQVIILVFKYLLS